MKIGIYFSSTRVAGGVYQYSTSLIDALLNIPGHEYTVFVASGDIPDYIRKSKRVRVVEIPVGHGILYLLSYLSLRLFSNSITTLLYKFTQKENIRAIENKNLDIMFYPTSSNLSFLAQTPSVVAIHDLMHRVNPQFLEVSAGGRWQNREYIFKNIAKHAFRILVDSEVSKKGVQKFYKARQEKVVILPFLSPSYLENNMSVSIARKICVSLRLPDKFIFYPARFWPHKNHLSLVQALYHLKREGKIVNLVLTGSKKAEFSTFNRVMKYVKDNDLEKQVLYLGYVDNEQISAIYKLASALVMPTFFGPTNIPVLEAWVMGTPVITSDIEGCRDQMGDAGLLVDPDNSADMAKKIWKIYNDGKLRTELVRRGKIRVNKWTFGDFSKKIAEILEDFKIQKYDSSKNN